LIREVCELTKRKAKNIHGNRTISGEKKSPKPILGTNRKALLGSGQWPRLPRGSQI
jgi:hypothetical protein